MPTIRTFSDGSKLAIPDMKITRRLDAITKWVSNHVVDLVITGGTTANAVSVAAGSVIMNNEIKTVAATDVFVGTYATHKWATVWLPSTAYATTVPTGSFVASSSTGYCPDSSQTAPAFVPDSAMLLAHVYRTAVSPTMIAQTDINIGVQPTLYYGTKEWKKDNNTDATTTA